MRFSGIAAAAAACALTLATQAQAQDFNGATYGASVGFGSGTYTQGTPENDLYAADIDVEGVMVGARVGYSVQNGRAVFGVDAEIGTGLEGSNPTDTDGDGWNCTTGPCNISIGPMGTLRARAGVLIDPLTQVYGAAGLAIAAVEGGIANSAQQGSSTASGITYAVGVERFTSPVTSLFGELAVIDLGTLTFGVDDAEEYDYTATGEVISLRVGLNVKF